MHQSYRGFIDAIVGDALYANGPAMTQLTKYGYGGFLVLKKEKDEPLKDARKLWKIEGAERIGDRARQISRSTALHIIRARLAHRKHRF